MRTLQRSSHIYQFKAKVWLYPGQNAAWHFVSVPKKQTKEIRDMYGGLARGWGSLPVEVTIGNTKWKTSIFPDRKTGTFLLPLKADIRKREHISNNNIINVTLEMRV